MEIALIRPVAPFNRYIQNVPLNYIHLAAYLREHGHRTRILDMVVEHSTDVVDNYIRDNAVKIAGIGCMTCELPDALAEAQRLKGVHPCSKLVLRAAHPSAAPDAC